MRQQYQDSEPRLALLNMALWILGRMYMFRNYAASLMVKVKLSLCFFFNWVPCHEGVLEEWRYSSTHSFTSALDGGEWSASCPGRFISRERAPSTHWIGGWVGPRAVLDAVVKRKIPSPRLESNPITPIVHPVVSRYTDWAIAASLISLKINEIRQHVCRLILRLFFDLMTIQEPFWLCVGNVRWWNKE
jgi:hypothetical protein